MTVPPEHVQPVGTFVPVLPVGQATGAQEEVKKGVVVVAVTDPLNPALHVQPAPTDVPVDDTGQATVLQAPVKKGVVDDASMVPEKPAGHVQPLGTPAPMGLGLGTAVHTEE